MIEEKETIANALNDMIVDLRREIQPLAALQAFIDEAACAYPNHFNTMDTDPLVAGGIADAMFRAVNAFKKFEKEIQEFSEGLAA